MGGVRILGIVLAVVGAVLLVVGLGDSHSFADQASQFFAGHYTQGTMAYVIVGLVSLLAGTLMALARQR